MWFRHGLPLASLCFSFGIAEPDLLFGSGKAAASMSN
jgi:hypothetical protein